MATKMDTKQAITPLVWKISRCRLHLVGVFMGGLLNDARQILSRPTASPWQRNLIAYNSCCIRDISETLASNRGFSGAGYQMMSVKRSDAGCNGNKIWDKIGYNSAGVRDIWENFVSNRGFGGQLWCQSNFENGRPWLPWPRNLRQKWL